MPTRRRYAVIGVLALAAVVGLALAHGLQWAAAELNLTDVRLFGLTQLPMSAAVAYGMAAALALVVLRMARTRTLVDEIVDELARVSWPSRQETSHATVIVIGAVVMSSAFLGLFDAAWMWVTDWILGARA